MENQSALANRDVSQKVKDLADAVSTQAQVANRSWLGLMTVALFAVLPRVPNKEGFVSLPFNLGDVPFVWFHAIVFSMLIILAIAFGAAHAQQVRVQKLAHLVIDSLEDEFDSGGTIHPRELFDMLRMPSLNRVAPLAQSLRGKYQFYKTKYRLPTWLHLASMAYYVLLKLASIIVYFGLPSWALFIGYRRLGMSGVLGFLLRAGGILAAAVLFQVLASDLNYSGRVFKHLWKQRSPLTKGENAVLVVMQSVIYFFIFISIPIFIVGGAAYWRFKATTPIEDLDGALGSNRKYCGHSIFTFGIVAARPKPPTFGDSSVYYLENYDKTHFVEIHYSSRATRHIGEHLDVWGEAKCQALDGLSLVESKRIVLTIEERGNWDGTIDPH